MKAREKLLVAVALLALLYGGWVLLLHLFVSDDSRMITKEVKRVRSRVAEWQKKVDDERLSGFEQKIIKAVEQGWGKNCFLQGKTGSELAKEELIRRQNMNVVPVDNNGKDAEMVKKNTPEEKLLLNYTGIVIVGKKRWAILDDLEYEIGEKIIGYDLFLIKIESDYVLLKHGKTNELETIRMRE